MFDQNTFNPYVSQATHPLQPQIHVVRLIVTPTNSYDQQYIRPHHSQLDAGVVREFTETLSTTPNITRDIMSNVASKFIIPDARPSGVADIPNGWDTRRGRFLLEVETRTTNMTKREIITGYTEYWGVSNLSGNNNIDPEMLFVINNISKVHPSSINNGHGVQAVFNFAGGNHVFADYNQTSYLDGSKKWLLTPKSIFSSMSPELFNNGGYPGRVFNSVSSVSAVPTLADVNTSSPLRYMTDVLDSYNRARRANTSDAARVDVIDDAIGKTESTAFSSFGFAGVLQNMYRMYTSKFKIRDLLDMDPHVLTKTTITPPDDIIPQGASEYWSTSNGTTIASQIIANAVPAIMLEYGISRLVFTSTNVGNNNAFTPGMLSPKPITFIADLATVYNYDITSKYNEIIDKLNVEVLKGVSINGLVAFDVAVTYDVLGTTTINMSLDGQPHVPYVLPSFSSSTMAPVLTKSSDDLSKIKNDFEAMINVIDDFTANAQLAGSNFLL